MSIDLVNVLISLSLISLVMSLRFKKKASRAICVFASDHSEIRGSVLMERKNDFQTVFKCDIKKIPQGLHGMHVHKFGDLSSGCASACDHYNPTGADHGGARGRCRHRGDLGNIEADASDTCKSVVVADVALCDIIGRMIVVHADEDDLGRGGDKESIKTGNAGKRIGCGVIGLVA